MTIHRLSAGAGYRYLLRHTACGDLDRAADTPLTAYYTASGYPPGRWTGAGLAGLADGVGLPSGAAVDEGAMAALFGAGHDPVSGEPLGRAYPTYRSVDERIAARVAALPAALTIEQRTTVTDQIQAAEAGRPASPGAVAGFDLTFTAPKSASVLWALADPTTQAAVSAAHRAAVDGAVAFIEARVLFTRVGARSCAQVPTHGAVAAGFDHWDTRTGDPNLHTHLVLANKVQGPDSAWRSVDSRALYKAAVAVSEIYDDLFADNLAARLPVRWGWRDRGPRRSPAFEVDGIDDDLLAEFSTRAKTISGSVQTAVTEFVTAHGRDPSRVEVLRLRQQATLATRPTKKVQKLADLMQTWRSRATHLLRGNPLNVVTASLQRVPDADPPARADDVPEPLVTVLATDTLNAVMERRSTWTRWNVLAEAARQCRGLRMQDDEQRHALHERVVGAVLAGCLALDPPELFTLPQEYRRPDGVSVFTRAGEDQYTHREILAAEDRLLAAHADTTGPTVRAPQPTIESGSANPAAGPGPVRRLAPDQLHAVATVATSSRRVEVLVGPAGSGKTTALLALRYTWETAHGPGSVIGLAPSATAARELGQALGIGCENTAKWLHESSGPAAVHRARLLAECKARRGAFAGRGNPATVRRLTEAIERLRAEHEAWMLRPGQLVIVDEASLAGTRSLDTLAGQAHAAGAKLLLVGDHRQLSPVDAGGAFGLLVEHGYPIELSSLWRFRHRWEADATRLLRAGDPACLDTYTEAGRIHDGPWEAMVEAAYTAYRTSESAGSPAILLAADTATVDALNARTRTDRVTAGTVAPEGITNRAGAVLGIGDRVLTRRNNRRISIPTNASGGHLDFVRNGMLWDIAAIHPDGSLTVTAANSQPTASMTVNLPARYVHDHVEHGYATTLHRAQGITVEASHVLAGPGMTREALYVGMTRGRTANHVYLATDLPDPTMDEIPDPDAAREARDIAESILAATGTERSAMQTVRQLQDDAASLARLYPIAATLAADATARRCMTLLPLCGLSPEQVRRIQISPARGALFAALRTGERLGYPMSEVLFRQAVARVTAETDDPVVDLAAVLHQRVTAWLRDREDATTAIDSAEALLVEVLPDVDAADPNDPVGAVLQKLDALSRGRLDALTADATTRSRPVWMRPLGPPPVDPDGRADWLRRVAAVAAHRDLSSDAGNGDRRAPADGDTVEDRRRRLSTRAATEANDLSRHTAPETRSALP